VSYQDGAGGLYNAAGKVFVMTEEESQYIPRFGLK